MGKVTRLPHDGRMIMGGKGCLIPFRPDPTKAAGSPPIEPGAPDEQPPTGDMSDPDLAKHFGWDKRHTDKAE